VKIFSNITFKVQELFICVLFSLLILDNFFENENFCNFGDRKKRKKKKKRKRERNRFLLSNYELCANCE
jgi:hypothetical protein